MDLHKACSPFNRVFEQTITAKDRSTVEVSQMTLMNFPARQKLNDKILHDIHSQESNILSNSMYMSRNKSEMVFQYEKGFNEVKKCGTIIQRYTVNIEELKKKL
ncbi:hypothetical protein DV872_02380 [Oceanispirochaeta sp. M1]|nr:hypothetical protein DV872_02380 [Oceanispirochaeta sp. M1]